MIHIDPITKELIEKKLCGGECGRYLPVNKFYQHSYGKSFKRCMTCQSNENKKHYHKKKILKSDQQQIGRPRTNVDLVGIVGRS